MLLPHQQQQQHSHVWHITREFLSFVLGMKKEKKKKGGVYICQGWKEMLKRIKKERERRERMCIKGEEWCTSQTFIYANASRFVHCWRGALPFLLVIFACCLTDCLCSAVGETLAFLPSRDFVIFIEGRRERRRRKKKGQVSREHTCVLFLLARLERAPVARRRLLSQRILILEHCRGSGEINLDSYHGF